jgi:hypothetical protein
MISRIQHGASWTVAPLIAVLMGVAAAPAGATEPSLRLVGTASTVDAVRFDPAAPATAGVPVYVVASSSTPFEIHAERNAFNKPFAVTQVTPGRRARVLPADFVNRVRVDGLARFLRLKRGAVLLSRQTTFCPAERQRFAAGSPETAVYPDDCGVSKGSNPFVLGRVWGIEAGWGAAALGFDQGVFDLPDGVYRAELAIEPRYRRLFGVQPRASAVAFTLRVRTETAPPPGPGPCPAAQATACPRPPSPAAEAIRPPSGERTVSPDPATLPDLAVLPAWGVQAIVDDRGHDELQFAATVWNSGPALLAVDGFREGGQDRMTAYQNFYRGGKRVGYRKVGKFEYDPRVGHEHWHFSDFATYRLLTRDGSRATRSGKQAFCLAPTDGVDLAVTGATWRPGSLGFSDCGSRTSLSLRETMPAGWGDTYVQSLPGQSFDITTLPNGRYVIEIVANPHRRLLETTELNDVSLREVKLGGVPGHRTATASPFQGVSA